MDRFEKGTRLGGRAAIVTGAGNGIGAATARLFAAQGARVLLTDVDEAALAATLGQIAAEVVQAAVGRFGKLDILINNAGVRPDAELGQITLEDWNRVIAIDLTGPFLGTQAVLPEMLKAGGGAIVNVSSVAAIMGGPIAHYHSAKAGVRALTRSTAFAYAKQRIRANAVYPGLIETKLTEAMLADPAFVTRMQATVPLPYFGSGADVAYGILFLASDEAKFVTGSDLVIDGGRTLR
jgi:NAD(P)-dependent dehydrogenase (short-subunit alcohol dehydrogenase family)